MSKQTHSPTSTATTEHHLLFSYDAEQDREWGEWDSLDERCEGARKWEINWTIFFKKSKIKLASTCHGKDTVWICFRRW